MQLNINLLGANAKSSARNHVPSNDAFDFQVRLYRFMKPSLINLLPYPAAMFFIG